MTELSLRIKNLISADPFLQRIIAATVVTTKATPDANVNGAVALRDYLVAQPRLRYPGYTQLWWPSGQNNDAAERRGGPPACPAEGLRQLP